MFLKRNNMAWLHVLFWCVIFIKRNILVLDASGLSFDTGAYIASFSLKKLLIELGYTSINMVAFYATYFAVRRAIVTRKFLYWPLMIIAVWALLVLYRAALEFGIFKSLLQYDNYRHNLHFSWRYFIPNVIMYYWEYMIYGLALAFFMHWQHTEKMRQQEYAAMKEAELSFLQSQINPHFLFNTINDIYALSLKKSDQAPEALMQLSGLLRYALYDNKQQAVPLERELDYIKDYLALQRVGYGQAFYIHEQYQGNMESWQLPPMLLLPFVENACKHGIVNDASSPVNISLLAETGELYFSVTNRIATGRKDATGGIGIDNISKRLELLYPDKYRLQISNTDDIFTIDLILYK
ncbi:sensor histidine kinase [Sediminibacterium ginsengisoli]|uniref:Histidine kinase n=1 Tax=Sediminibacterium ginsengisoli TaxID=413434 RepID=A0A1T4JY65_9BACT|nr:histidine kinase [Sediminibacterium ginsengisoli]SJZ35103.1 Histidine kinase [Sediminibacterium ginsengisoli]